MIVTNLNWIFLIACMSAMRTHAAFKFVPILDKHASKETKNLQENQKPHFNKKILVTLSSLSDNKTCWKI